MPEGKSYRGFHDKGLTTSNQNRVFNKKAGPSMPGGPKDTSIG